MSNIRLSIGLPLYNSSKIVWLALNSLCGQKNINFEWELVICEEKKRSKFKLCWKRIYI